MTIDATLTAVIAPLLAAGDALGDWLGALAADSIWQSEPFKKQSWERLMNGLRTALTLGGALLLIYEWRARRLRERVPINTQRVVAVVMTVLAFGVYFDFFNPNVRFGEYYHRHEYFHYYLGSKYHKELGYQRIYECTAVAETELGRRAQVARRELRDLRVNLIKPISDTYVLKDPGQCKDNFSEEKWEAFKKDVDWFYNSSRGSYWTNMQKDHGYNPPPVWTMAGKFFSSFGTAAGDFFKVLSGIDIALHLAIVLLMYWAFGFRIGAIATVWWGCNAPANFYWTGGAFMRQDWIFFLIASVCLLRKRYFALGGAALVWSAMLRVFPAGLFAGPVIVTVLYAWRKRKLAKEHVRFFAGAAVAGALLFGVSAAVTGMDAYKSFAHHITTHRNTALTNHMGVKTMLTHTWKGRMRFTRNDNLDDPFEEWKDGRASRDDKTKPIRYGIFILFGLWAAWALRRTKSLWLSLPFGLPLVMTITDLTCYYFSCFMIAAVLARARPAIAPAFLALSGGSNLLLHNYYWVDDKYTAQSYLFFVFCLVMLAVYSRPFSVARLKAFLERKPEPRAAAAGESSTRASPKPSTS